MGVAVRSIILVPLDGHDQNHSHLHESLSPVLQTEWLRKEALMDAPRPHEKVTRYHLLLGIAFVTSS